VPYGVAIGQSFTVNLPAKDIYPSYDAPKAPPPTAAMYDAPKAPPPAAAMYAAPKAPPPGVQYAKPTTVSPKQVSSEARRLKS
jgi:hypothetical protein